MPMPTIPSAFAFSAGGSVELPSKNDGVTVESSEDKISFSGNFDITRDAHGLELAQALSLILQQTMRVLSKDHAAGNLPDRVEVLKPIERPNPFGSGS